MLAALVSAPALANPPGARSGAPLSAPSDAGPNINATPLVVCSGSSEVHALERGRWQPTLTQVPAQAALNNLRVNDGKSLFVLLDPSHPRALSTKPAWGLWSRSGGVEVLKTVRGGAEISGLRKLPRGPLFSARSEFHGVHLKREPGRTVVSARGAKSPRIRKDGAYLYALQPKMGGKEEPHFTDLIEGSLMTLRFVAPRAKEQVLATAPVIANPRFVGLNHAVYWRSGVVRERDNFKTWILERVTLSDGTRRKLLTWEGPIRHKGRWQRSAPPIRAFERSSWILTTDGFDRGQGARHLAVEVRSGAARRLNLPAHLRMVPALPGYEPHPLVMARTQQAPHTLSIWDVRKQRPLAKLTAPCTVKSATFLN